MIVTVTLNPAIDQTIVLRRPMRSASGPLNSVPTMPASSAASRCRSPRTGNRGLKSGSSRRTLAHHQMKPRTSMRPSRSARTAADRAAHGTGNDLVRLPLFVEQDEHLAVLGPERVHRGAGAPLHRAFFRCEVGHLAAASHAAPSPPASRA